MDIRLVLPGQNRGTSQPEPPLLLLGFYSVVVVVRVAYAVHHKTIQRVQDGGTTGAPVGRKFPPHLHGERMLICSDIDKSPEQPSETHPLTALLPRISNARTMDGGSSGETRLTCCY